LQGSKDLPIGRSPQKEKPVVAAAKMENLAGEEAPTFSMDVDFL
jgi:hypothetical protein